MSLNLSIVAASAAELAAHIADLSTFFGGQGQITSAATATEPPADEAKARKPRQSKKSETAETPSAASTVENSDNSSTDQQSTAAEPAADPVTTETTADDAAPAKPADIDALRSFIIDEWLNKAFPHKPDMTTAFKAMLTTFELDNLKSATAGQLPKIRAFVEAKIKEMAK